MYVPISYSLHKTSTYPIWTDLWIGYPFRCKKNICKQDLTQKYQSQFQEIIISIRRNSNIRKAQNMDNRESNREKACSWAAANQFRCIFDVIDQRWFQICEDKIRKLMERYGTWISRPTTTSTTAANLHPTASSLGWYYQVENVFRLEDMYQAFFVSTVHWWIYSASTPGPAINTDILIYSAPRPKHWW